MRSDQALESKRKEFKDRQSRVSNTKGIKELNKGQDGGASPDAQGNEDLNDSPSPSRNVKGPSKAKSHSIK